MNDVRPAIMPKAREDRLIIKELPDETLVYDLDTDEAHCLNSTAAVVWKNCDGQKPIMQITAALEEEVQAPVDETVVWLALEQLEKFKLLQPRAVLSQVTVGMSRRRLMRNFGIAAIALPAIVSIISPTPSQAQSGCGTACTGNGQCNVPGCGNCVGPVGSKSCQP